MYFSVVQAQPVQVMVGAPMTFGENPMTCVCPHCQASVVTNIDYKTGILTWALAGACILMT